MIKLYLDEDVHKKVATALRLKGYDAVSAHEVQKQSLSDDQQLEFAVSEARAIFTFNAGDFEKLHKRRISGVRSITAFFSQNKSLSEKQSSVFPSFFFRIQRKIS